MKKIHLLLFMICLFAISPSWSQVITDGLVGFWPFNGNANDLSTYGNDGIVNGAVLSTDRNNVAQSAYEFDGVDDFISIPSPFYNFSQNEMTISFWINFESFQIGAGMGHALENDGTDWQNQTVWLFHGEPSSNSFKFYVNTGALNTATLDSSRWYHVTLWAKNNELRIYLDGILHRTAFHNRDIIINSNAVIHLGKDPRVAQNRWLAGKFDDLYIFNRALSDQEVIQLYETEDLSDGMLCASVYCDGENVGIGTTDTRDYKLAVAGKTITEEVNVSLVANWPDYVFSPEYELKSLEELKKQIIVKGHLPDIPNKADVMQYGLNLGEMNAKLLQKIEELTLYMIEQNQKSKSLSEQMTVLNQKVSELQQENQELKILLEN